MNTPATTIASTHRMESLRIYLLGPLRFEANGVELTGIATRRAELLLAYLISTSPKVHPRGSLANLFWPDSLPDASRYNVRYALWSVRKALREAGLDPANYISSSADTIKFNLKDTCWLDTAAFEENLKSAAQAGPGKLTLEKLEQAVALFRGGFLEGTQTGESLDLENWLEMERRSWEHKRLTALDKLVEVYLHLGYYEKAITQCHRILQIDPLREQTHQQLMQIYWKIDQRPMALQQYQRYKTALKKDLNVEPMDTTKELYKTILREAPQLVSQAMPLQAVPSRLVESPLGFFIDREEPLKLLAQHFNQAKKSHSSLVLVTGEAGIGKTQLLMEFARQMENEVGLLCWGNCYPGEQGIPFQPIIEAVHCVLNYLSHDQLSTIPSLCLQQVGRLVPEIIDLVPVKLFPSDLPTEQARSRLFEGIANFLLHVARGESAGNYSAEEIIPFHTKVSCSPILLTIDNIQWADESTLQLIGFLVRRMADTPILMIATYRPEDVPTQHPIHQLERLLSREGLLTRIELDPLPEADIVASLKQQAPEDQRMVLFARRLFRESEGNPFFLAEMVRSFMDNDKLILQPDGAWRLEDSLMEVIDVSIPLPSTIRDLVISRYEALEQESQQVLNVAVVVGSAFQYRILCRALDIAEEKLLQILDVLLERKFVKEEAAGRFEFTHDNIRQILYESISQTRRAFLHRKVGIALEESYADNLSPIYGDLSRHFLLGGEQLKAFDYSIKEGKHARNLYAHQVALDYFQQAIQISSQLSGLTTGDLHSLYEETGDIAVLIGNFEQGLAGYQQAMEYASLSQDDLERSVLWRKIGYLREKCGDYPGALAALESGFRQLPPQDLPQIHAERARLKREAAWVHMRLASYEKSRAYLLEGIKELETLRSTIPAPDVQVEGELGRLWRALGDVECRQSKYDTAIQHLKKGLTIHEAIGDDFGIGRGYNNLGYIYYRMGDYQVALEHLQRSMAIVDRVGDIIEKGACLHHLGLVYQGKEDLEKAYQYYQESKKIFERTGHIPELPPLFNDLGKICLLMNEQDQALIFLEKGIQVAEEIDDRDTLSLLHSTMAIAQIRAHNSEAALSHASQALSFAQDTGSAYNLAIASRVLGKLLVTSQPDTARQHLKESLELFSKIGEPLEIARSQRDYGKYLLSNGDSTGQELLSQARAAFEKLGVKTKLDALIDDLPD